MVPDEEAPADEQVDEEAPAGQPADESPIDPPDMVHGAALGDSGGQVTVHPDRDGYLSLIEALRADGYWVCADLCAVDYLGYGPPRALPAGVVAERFEVVVSLLDPGARRRIRVRVQVPGDDPTLASITALHPGATNPEREAFDLFGIVFEGHPDPTRILMPEEWEGHPLRKDYSVGRIPVQFKAAGPVR